MCVKNSADWSTGSTGETAAGGQGTGRIPGLLPDVQTNEPYPPVVVLNPLAVVLYPLAAVPYPLAALHPHNAVYPSHPDALV